MPLPRGTTTETLARLTAAIERYAIERIYILGDFLHAKQSLQVATIAALRAWRARHAASEIFLISGNHDRHAGPPPAELKIDVCAQMEVGPYVLAHHPRPSERGYVLAGHLHPATRISGRGDSVRLPCYWLRESVAVLPAFGAFTGAYEISREPQDRVYALADERVFKMPPQRDA